MSRVLQITDCHLVADGTTLIGVDTQATLEAVLEQAFAEHIPDAILVTGDIAHDPTPDVYARFRTTLARLTSAPVLCVPGNHDVRSAMTAAHLPFAPLELGVWCVVGLDSHEDELPRARIETHDKEQVREAFMGTKAAHVMVATHHPLLSVDCPWLDKDRIQSPEELVQWLSKCSAGRVRTVVFGHAHQAVSGVCAGVPVYGTPSTCFQFLPRSESFSIDTLPPGYRWIELAADGSLHTEVRRAAHVPMDIDLKVKH